MLKVYSPCVEPLEYAFDGIAKELPPKAVTELQDGEARLVVERFNEYGVSLFYDEIGADIKKAAEVAWSFANRRWAEKTIIDWRKSTTDKRDAGIDVEEPNDVKVARGFLKIGAAILASLLWIAPAFAAETEQRSANFTYKHDIATTTLTYYALEGENGDPFATPRAGGGRIETTGSSTSVTEETTGQNPFAGLGEGDVIMVDKGNLGIDTVVIDTFTDAANIVVHTAVDWSAGYSFRYWKRTGGTTVTDGWISVAGWSTVQLTFQYDAGDVTQAVATWECKEQAMGAGAVRVYPGDGSSCGDGTLVGTTCHFGTTGQRLSVNIFDNAFGSCRIGMAYLTTDGATREEATATITVTR